MWLSKQMRSTPPTADADLGVTTIAGDRVGVLTRGEVRALPVYGPGGYVWLPENGNGVLVVKGGPGGNSIYLRKNGNVEIQGTLVINGKPYEPCTCSKEVL